MSTPDCRYQEALELCHREGRFRTPLPIRHQGAGRILLEGQSLLNLCSNDYLGLQGEKWLWHKFLEEEAANYLPSASSSRLLSGNDEIYTRFEAELSQLYHKPSALLWESGFHANSGALPVLALPSTLFLVDRLAHASIIDGVRASGAPFHRFRHNDLGHLRTLLERYSEQYQTIWVVTESLFSMDGDFAPLKDIIGLKRLYPHLLVYLDEAHAMGVCGEEGLGYASQIEMLEGVDLFVGTFGKALASVGAFTLQSEALKGLLTSEARPFIFSTALPPINVAWTRYLFTAQRAMAERRAKLRGLQSLFGELSHRTIASPIIPVIVPGEEAVQAKAKQLQKAGFFVRPIRKPTVPEGQERIRISLTAALTPDEIKHIVAVINA